MDLQTPTSKHTPRLGFVVSHLPYEYFIDFLLFDVARSRFAVVVRLASVQGGAADRQRESVGREGERGHGSGILLELAQTLLVHSVPQVD